VASRAVAVRAPFASVTALLRPSPRQARPAASAFLAESSSDWDSDERTSPRGMPRGSSPSEEKEGRQCCGGAAPSAAGPTSAGKRWSAGTMALCMLLECFLTLNFVFVQPEVASHFASKHASAPDEAKPAAAPKASEMMAAKWAAAELEKFGPVFGDLDQACAPGPRRLGRSGPGGRRVSIATHCQVSPWECRDWHDALPAVRHCKVLRRPGSL